MRLENLTSERWVFIIDHPEKLPQGVNLWYKGVPYPRRVYHSNERDVNFFLRTLDALGIVKKYLFSLTYLRSIVIPRTLNPARYSEYMQHLLLIFNWTLDEFFIKKEEYSVPVLEMGKFVEKFLLNLGIRVDVAEGYAQVAMMILEFDCAYRYRAQDMAGETSNERLQNPRKELLRLFNIYMSREVLHKDIEDWGAKGKVGKIKLLAHLMILPKFKKAFVDALDGIDLEKIKFNEADRFHICYWYGYDFEGKTLDERFSPFEELFKVIPYQKREDPKIIADFITGN